jgi:tRNA (guanosine-2'-O-)-methyltransferase
MEDAILYQELCKLISERRATLFNTIAPNRTRHIQLVLEDIFQSQNASAVLRTCDILGIQDVHVIETRNKYSINKDVSLGSSKWIDLHRYTDQDDPLDTCLNGLKKNGVRLIATSPRTENSTPLNELSIDEPMAILFGTELNGLTDRALSYADELMHIPMVGFTESFNISVSAAITLYQLRNKLHDSKRYFLNEQEQLTLKIRWAKSMLRASDDVEQTIKRQSS